VPASASNPVVVLAGGTGGAKFARGMLDVVGEDLVVIANTGDDVDVYGAHVSPDPDLVTFWLCDRIDERGWGLAGDTFHVMDGLRDVGVDVWFNLGDRDLAVCVERRRRLDAGERLTDAIAAIAAALGVRARVLPMSDAQVRTRVKAADRWWEFQEFMIRRRGEGPVQDVAFDGADTAPPAAAALEAIASARAIVIGPSNPIVSIGPILALTELREAIARAAAPVVAVSPIVGGEVLKGPTQTFMAWAGHALDAAGVADAYDGLLDGLVCDEEAAGIGLPVLRTDTLLADAEGRARVARETLRFAEGLAA
jgi:LPPG:FO 2-phospho-L-lactate transferase